MDVKCAIRLRRSGGGRGDCREEPGLTREGGGGGGTGRDAKSDPFLVDDRSGDGCSGIFPCWESEAYFT